MDPRSRRVPSMAFDDGASIRSRAYYGPNAQRLRPAESRVSLREQFASTRREYEFGFDDASSFLERSTLASEAIHGDDNDDAVVVGMEPLASPGSNPVYRDCYELLCLPKGTSLSPDQVQDAAHRLIQVLAVSRQPPRLQSPAAFYLGLTQAAFEILVDPSRRLGYDLSRSDDPSSDCDEVVIDEEEHILLGDGVTYESRLQEQYLLLTQRESRESADLSLRIDAASLLASQRVPRRHGASLDVLDLSLRKSTTTSVPALRKPIERAAMFVLGLASKEASGPETAHSLRLADPTMTIIGSMHGLLDEPYKLAPLLLDHYQPPGPSIHGRRRMEQLLVSRFLPMLSMNLRQELFWQSESLPPALPNLVIEQELELLPQPSTTTRIGHSLNLPGSDGPLNIEVSAQKLLTRRADLAPSLGLAVHQRVGPGTAFVVADGGDWNLRTSKECRELSKFSKISGGLAPMIDVFRNPPTVEVGYAFGRHDLGVQSGQALTKPSERGLSGVDHDLNENKPSSWTLSTGLTPGNAAAYLRYGRDFFSSLTTPSKPPRNNSHPTNKRTKSGFRAEAELAATTQRDFFLAFRALKRIGRYSKAGLEVGLSPTNLHVSLYWSRLGQRITLPFLVATTTANKSRLLPTTATTTTTTTKLLFWTTLFPFAALAAWELYRQRQRAARAPTGKAHLTPQGEKALQAYVARRRAEADELTVVLATGVEPRQQAERQRGGLVIVSAKYGVRDAPPEEVADVTIAVAALVDEKTGGLVIPRGVRKSRLLGFWDPAPLSTKVLRVRYLWRGRELAVEVSGREELRLP